MPQQTLTLFDSSVVATAEAGRTIGGYIKKLHVINPNVTDAYLQLFDLAVADVTLGTTTPKVSFLIPAGSGGASGAYADDFGVDGLHFQTAITYACTTTATGNTAPTTGLILNVVYI